MALAVSVSKPVESKCNKLLLVLLLIVMRESRVS